MEITCDIFGEPCRGRGGAGSQKLGRPAHQGGRPAHQGDRPAHQGSQTQVRTADCNAGKQQPGRLECPWAAAGPGRATSRRAEPHVNTPGTTGVEGAGGTGGHGRASRSTTPSEARVWRSRGRPGPTAPGTPVGPPAAQPTGQHIRRPEHPWRPTTTRTRTPRRVARAGRARGIG